MQPRESVRWPGYVLGWCEALLQNSGCHQLFSIRSLDSEVVHGLGHPHLCHAIECRAFYQRFDALGVVSEVAPAESRCDSNSTMW